MIGWIVLGIMLTVLVGFIILNNLPDYRVCMRCQKKFDAKKFLCCYMDESGPQYYCLDCTKETDGLPFLNRE
jgi:hypothetical protein